MKLNCAIIIMVAFISVLVSCGGFGDKSQTEDTQSGIAEEENRKSDKKSGYNIDKSFYDEYTFAKPDEAVIKHLELDIEVDFDRKVIKGRASYEIENRKSTGVIYFDTKNLSVEKVTLGDNDEDTKFALGYFVEEIGKPLEVYIKPSTKKVNIYYATHPKAIALQWLLPQQTEGKKHPYLFTQSEPAYSRSWVPSQDSPGIRFTYNAKVKVPKGLMAVMSASNPQKKNDDGIYYFEMKQPIPAYLLALAVGDIVFKPVGIRTGVYAEPLVVDKAAYEFGEMEQMLITVEELYGEYKWERYDVIVLPPSFPFGGMENPRLTFLTPTVLAGDRSLVSIVAHELAHSWSGNLVTSATWNDFWINEGFTVYLEKRIMEVLYGKSYMDMLALLGYQDLLETIDQMGEESHDTHLKLKLNGRDPDEAVTDIAYEKGALFLQMIEEAVGRKRWDGFLKDYFNKFAFQSMSSERFVEYLQNELIKGDSVLVKKLAVESWVYGPGIPENCPLIKSNRFELVDAEVTRWIKGTAATSLAVENWTTHEWLHFIRRLPEDISIGKMEELDKAFGFTNSGNSEILAAWFIHAINNNYSPAYDKLENFLITVGRRKFLRPLYKEMSKTRENKAMAMKIYKEARRNYHSVSTGTIDEILGWNQAGKSLSGE